MSHLLKSLIHWASPAAVLLLLSACSQPSPPQSNSAAPPSPIAEQTEPAPVTPTERSRPAAEPDGTTHPAPSPGTSTQAPASTAASKSAPKSASQSAAGSQSAPTATVDTTNPTFRATQRLAGFSADGSHYLYLESSRDTGAGIPKSSIQVVDIAANTCADNGCLETRYGEADANRATTDAEQDLLKQTWKVRQALNLTPPTAGTELPIIARSRTADGTETVTVRLPNRNQPLQLRLKQTQIKSPISGGTAKQDKAAMQLEVTYDGQHQSLDSLSNFREWVLGYSIRAVKLSPDGKHIAVLLTATKPTFEGTLATTLVQGFELN